MKICKIYDHYCGCIYCDFSNLKPELLITVSKGQPCLCLHKGGRMNLGRVPKISLKVERKLHDMRMLGEKLRECEARSDFCNEC